MYAALIAKGPEEDRKNIMFTDYTDADSGKYPVSALPLVILRAGNTNTNKIRRARNTAIKQGILFTDFLETITDGTYTGQMEKTAELNEKDLNYRGLCLFGKKR